MSEDQFAGSGTGKVGFGSFELAAAEAARATGDYLILWPADMPAEPADLAPYVAQFGRADVIVGVRQARVGYNPLMRFNAWLYPKLVATLFGLRLRDVNWIHAYRRDLFARITLTQRGIPMLVEALVRLRDLGARFAEVDVQMKVRLGGVALGGLVVMIVAVVADEADVDGGEQREDEGLDQADEQLRLAQRVGGRSIGHHGVARPVLPALPGQPLEAALGGQCEDLVAARVARHHIEGALADGAGGAEDGDETGCCHGRS